MTSNVKFKLQHVDVSTNSRLGNLPVVKDVVGSPVYEGVFESIADRQEKTSRVPDIARKKDVKWRILVKFDPRTYQALKTGLIVKLTKVKSPITNSWKIPDASTVPPFQLYEIAAIDNSNNMGTYTLFLVSRASNNG